ncbi:MAG: endoglucanase [Candidatus Marinimicrobia bacterium]|nr:endoglucanase [Candidatus Neomarinimicrobiota bacterium]
MAIFLTKQIRLYLLILSFILIYACQSAIEPQNLDESKIDPFLQNQKLSKTINLGNALDAPFEGDWGVTLDKSFFEIIKSAGFTGVRLPVRWSNHTLIDSPFTINKSFFERVDWAIENSFNNDLAVVFNIHHFEEMASNPIAQKQKLLSIWSQIAMHYKDFSDDLIFELLNEPTQKLTPDMWNIFLSEGIEIIRGIDQKRTLVVGSANWNSISSLNQLKVPPDSNLIITVHYYSPFQFTHQGADWVENADSWLGTKWVGSEEQKKAIENDLQLVVDWGQANNRPMFLGEFGAYSKADFNSRFRWTEYIVSSMEKKEISWSYWEFCSGFGAWDQETEKWNELLLALIQDR